MKLLLIFLLQFSTLVYGLTPLRPPVVELIDLSSQRGHLITIKNFSKDEWSDWETILGSPNSRPYASVRAKFVDFNRVDIQWRIDNTSESDLVIAIINKFYSVCPPSIYRCFSASSPRLDTTLSKNDSFIFPTYTISFKDDNQELIDISNIEELYVCNFKNEIPSQFYVC